MEKADIVIIGAGVIGLAIAREIAGEDRNIVILERNSSFGQETSSRNSEVIHSGLYYPSNSLKAKTCVEGRHLIYEMCEKNNIPYKKIGKFIMATEKEEMSLLQKLITQGQNNGVEDLRIINQKELKTMEPNVFGLFALYSPSTGIVNSHKLMEYLLDGAKSKGVIVAYNCDVIDIKKVNDGYKVSIRNNEEILLLKTRILINCAGLDSDIVAGMVGIDTKKCGYSLYFCRGEYFRIKSNKSSLIKRLIYPVPKPKGGGLGIHVTLDLGGNLRLGPDDEYLEKREKNYFIDDSKRCDFYQEVKRFLPFIEENDLAPDMVGIRPKLQAPEDDFRDFVIQEESEKGFLGLINLIGIESPGLTASISIARLVRDIIDKIS